MITRRRVAAVTVLVAVLLLATLAIVEAGVPVMGVSRGDAIATAERQVQSTDGASVQWAVVAPLVFFRGGASDLAAPWNEMVWAIRLKGTYPPGSCGPAPLPGQRPHCPPDNHTATVMLDYRTGRFVMARIEP